MLCMKQGAKDWQQQKPLPIQGQGSRAGCRVDVEPKWQAAGVNANL